MIEFLFYFSNILIPSLDIYLSINNSTGVLTLVSNFNSIMQFDLLVQVIYYFFLELFKV